MIMRKNSLLKKVNGKESDGVHPAERVDNEQHLKKENGLDFTISYK